MSAAIYEVNLSVDADIAADFQAWLPGHLDDVIATGCFVSAQVFLEQRATDTDDVAICVHYHAKSHAQIERYLEEFAATMRAEGQQRFGTKFRATRRVLLGQSL
jgi:hypothetical protein